MKNRIKESFLQGWEQVEISILLGLIDGPIQKKYVDYFKDQLRVNNILIYAAGHEYSEIFGEQNKIIVQAIINANQETILT